NINRRKKAGTSRSKKKSTISAKAYKAMKAGFPKKKKTTKKKRQFILKFSKQISKDIDLNMVIYLKLLK
ncbi:MAG: hypothetical protein ACPGRT_04165, partial [Flavobacteriaceae bacterium]